MSIPPSTSAPPSASLSTTNDVAVALFQSLENALNKEYARRYDTGVVLHHTESTRAGASIIRLEIDDQERRKLTANLVVIQHDDAAFEVACALENGGDRRFSYRLPIKADATATRLPWLGHALATFLLDERESRLARLTHDDFEEPAYADM